MARKDSYNKTASFKVNSEQKEYIKELKANGVSLRDVLQYYKDNTTNETTRLNNRLKYLVKHINELEKELKEAREELKEVRVKLKLAPTEDQSEIPVSITGAKLLNNCKIRNNGKTDSKTLAYYMETKEAEKIISRAMIEYSEKDPQEFKNKLYKYLKL